MFKLVEHFANDLFYSTGADFTGFKSFGYVYETALGKPMFFSNGIEALFRAFFSTLSPY
jgi:hypothetical protein